MLFRHTICIVIKTEFATLPKKCLMKIKQMLEQRFKRKSCSRIVERNLLITTITFRN